MFAGSGTISIISNKLAPGEVSANNLKLTPSLNHFRS